MELKGEHRLAADRGLVWSMLNDPGVLEACVPGAESFTPAADDCYDVTLTATLGPVRAQFKGRIELADVDAPSTYTLKFRGQGAAGFARGHARVVLAADGGHTVLAYVAHAQIGGKLAQVGSRLVAAAAGALADKFFGALAQELQARSGFAQADL
jgi:uncharacterized protein